LWAVRWGSRWVGDAAETILDRASSSAWQVGSGYVSVSSVPGRD